MSITFEYDPGTTVDTDQDLGKAEVLFDSGAVDDDGVSFIIVTDESTADDVLEGVGRRFFEGNVAIDAKFEANEDIDNFGSQTFIHFYDDANGGLLQSIVYHTSCSQPIQLGDVIGNATLVGYVGETGSVGQTNAKIDGVSSRVISLDTLPVVNWLNANQLSEAREQPLGIDDHGPVTAMDTLLVVNRLDEQPAKVPHEPPAVESRALEELLASLADDEDDGLLEDDLLDLLV